MNKGREYEPEANRRFSGVLSAARNSAFLVSTQFISIVIRLIYLYILVRVLTPDLYGVLNYSLSWYLVLLPFTFLGADVVLSREIGNRRETASALLGVTLGLRFLAALVVMIVSVFLANFIERDDYVRDLVMLFSASLLGRSLWMWSASVFAACEEAHLVLRFEVVARMFEVGVLIAFLTIVGPDLRGIAIIHACSWLLQAVASIAAIGQRYTIKFGWPDGGWLTALRKGVSGATVSIAIAAFFQLPIVVFRHIQGIGDPLGHFALGFQIVTYLLTIPYLIANASLPVLSRSAVRDDQKDRTAVILLAIIILLGGGAIAAVASLVVDPVVAKVFGDSYVAAGNVVAVGLWLLVPGSLAILLQQVLFSRFAHSLVGTVAPLIGVVAMSALLPGLIATSGYIGALVSVGIGIVVWLGCVFAALWKAKFFKNSATLRMSLFDMVDNNVPRP